MVEGEVSGVVDESEKEELDKLDSMLEKEVGPANAEAEAIRKEEEKLEARFGSWTMAQFVEAIEAVNYLLGTMQKGQKALNRVTKSGTGSGAGGMEAIMSKMMGGMLKR